MFLRSGYVLRQFSRAGAILATLVATAAFAAGPKAYVGNFKDNTVSVIDTDAGAVVATVPVAAGPHGMAMTHDGRNVYVSGDCARRSTLSTRPSDQVAQTSRLVRRRTVWRSRPTAGCCWSPSTATTVRLHRHLDARGDRNSDGGKAAYFAISTTASSPTSGRRNRVTSRSPSSTLYAGGRSQRAARQVAAGPEFGYDGKVVYFTQAGSQRDPGSRSGVGQDRCGNSDRRIAAFRRLSIAARRSVSSSCRGPASCSVRPGNQQPSAQHRGRQTAALGCHRSATAKRPM